MGRHRLVSDGSVDTGLRLGSGLLYAPLYYFNATDIGAVANEFGIR